MRNAHKDPSIVSVMDKVCAYILLRLSGERLFAVSINKPYNHSLPIKIADFHGGNYADLIILVCYKLIITSKDNSHLARVVIPTITNLSPYIGSLTLLTSSKLISLFAIFSA